VPKKLTYECSPRPWAAGRAGNEAPTPLQALAQPGKVAGPVTPPRRRSRSSRAARSDGSDEQMFGELGAR